MGDVEELASRYNAGTMDFEVVGDITDVETFAIGMSIRELPRLRRDHGAGRWRKRKGIARVRLTEGSVWKAEVHWYEAHGIGRVELKIKRFLDD
ncbi:MAG TPA: hypothetical protein VF590_18925 [Isosphaeraceae bacterium]